MKHLFITLTLILIGLTSFSQNKIAIKPYRSFAISEHFTGTGQNTISFNYDKGTSNPAALLVTVVEVEEEIAIYYNKTEFYINGKNKLKFYTVPGKKYLVILHYVVLENTETNFYDTLFITNFKFK
jgi:hypothetical protein